MDKRLCTYFIVEEFLSPKRRKPYDTVTVFILRKKTRKEITLRMKHKSRRKTHFLKQQNGRMIRTCIIRPLPCIWLWRGAEMADTPYRCRPFPAPLHSRHIVLYGGNWSDLLVLRAGGFDLLVVSVIRWCRQQYRSDNITQTGPKRNWSKQGNRKQTDGEDQYERHLVG